MEKRFGMHVAKTMLQHRTDAIESVLLSDRRKDRRLREIERLARAGNVTVKRLPHQELNELADGNKHQGVIVLSQLDSDETGRPSLTDWLGGISDASLIVALDGIADPRNLGACLRSANAAGVDGVILPRNRGCPITPTVSRTAAGAAETTPIHHASNLARALDDLRARDFFVTGLDEFAADSIYDIDFTGPCVLVFGTEESGLRLGTRKKCDQLVRIPMHGEITSLNVSVAVGVTAFEAVRQRSAI